MSRTIDILNAIKTGSTYTEPVLSRSENILKAICNKAENLINVSTATIEGGALRRFEIPLANVKGKTISASAFVENKSTEGNGARIRIDVTNNGTVSYAMGNDIATGRNGISKAENVSVPQTATKVELSVQSYSGNVGDITFSRFMVNFGSTVKPYTQYLKGAESKYETLLLAIKNGNNFLPFPYLHTTKTLNGITWTVNADHTVSVNGTLNGTSSNFLFTSNIRLHDGKYSLPANYNSGAWYVHGIKANGGEVDYNIQNRNNEFIASQKYLQYSIGYIVNKNEAVNFVITPLLKYIETPQADLEKLLAEIANKTLDEYLSGKNLFEESAWKDRETVDGKKCLVFNGFFAATTGNKIGNPLLIATDLPVGTYTVKGKFKKTQNFNALAGMNESNERTAFGTFKDNFTADTITFTTTEKLKYLYIDTGTAAAEGYCEIETLMFGKSLSEQYSPYCFGSEIETAFYKTFGAD